MMSPYRHPAVTRDPEHELECCMATSLMRPGPAGGYRDSGIFEPYISGYHCHFKAYCRVTVAAAAASSCDRDQ